MRLLGSTVIATLSTSLFVLTGKTSNYSTRWYESLRKPSWLTFEKSIPLIWGFIYVCTTISAIITWNRAKGPKARRSILSLLALNGAFNFLYGVTFTRRHDIFGAFLDSAAVAATITQAAVWQWPVSKVAALLNLPYIVWGAIATYITWFIYQANKGERI